jgi:hypothetical protein
MTIDWDDIFVSTIRVIWMHIRSSTMNCLLELQRPNSSLGRRDQLETRLLVLQPHRETTACLDTAGVNVRLTTAVAFRHWEDVAACTKPQYLSAVFS